MVRVFCGSFPKYAAKDTVDTLHHLAKKNRQFKYPAEPLFDRAILFQVHHENFAEPFQFFRRILVRSFQTVPFSFVPVIGQLSRPIMKTDASGETPEIAREGVCAPLKQPSLFSARWLHPQFFVTQFRGDAALRGSV